MTVQRLCFVMALTVTSFFFGRLNLSQAGDGPNQVSESDVAVGSFVDSIFEPELRRQSPPKNRGNASRRRGAAGGKTGARRRAGLRAKLVNNPDTSDGTPPFALVDRYGGVLRYVEPVESIDLESYLGEIVAVRRDTGDILLASQLAFPKTSRGDGDLQFAAFAEPTPADGPEPIEAGEMVGEPMPMFEEEGPLYFDEGYGGDYDSGIDFGGCDDCGRGVPCRRRGGGCGLGARGVIYVHGEYLIGRIEGMNTPPLVTQFTGIDPASGAAIGPFTTLFGGTRTLEDERNGGRITLGVWLDDYGQWGVEGEYLRLGDLEESFTAGVKDGLPPAAGSFIGRPFFNTGVIGGDLSTRGPSIEDVDTSAIDGTVRVDIRSEFQSAGIRLRHNLCCREERNTCCGDTVGCGSDVGCGSRVSGSGVGCQNGPLSRLCGLLRKGTRRTDVLYGLRWTSLDESLQVTEDLQELTGTTPPLGDDLDVFDRFATENNFLGGEIGYETEWQYRRWSLNLLSKVAIGNTRQQVDINGETSIDNGAPLTGGLLTQRYVHPGDDGIPGNADDFVVGNIGSYERDEFSMIPELGLTMGYNLTQRLKLTAGYTLIYWSNVVRPGDQIDLDVNANLIPREGVAIDPDTIELILTRLCHAIILALNFARPISGPSF